MAARSAGEVSRCRACHQALLLMPRALPVAAYLCDDAPERPVECPFCGFLNRPAHAARPAARLTLVRSAEAQLARDNGRTPMPKKSTLPVTAPICPFLVEPDRQHVADAAVTAA
jgi:hypothetical protein